MEEMTEGGEEGTEDVRATCPVADRTRPPARPRALLKSGMDSAVFSPLVINSL